MSVLTTATQSVTGAIDRRRADSDLAAPGIPTVALAGAVAIAVSLAVTFALAQLGRAIFTVPALFDKFNFSGYAPLTAGGVIGATIAWGLVSRHAPTPRWLLSRLAVLVTVVLLLPDVLLFPQAGNPAGPVLMLMVMHIAIAVIAYYSLVLIAPVLRRAAR